MRLPPLNADTSRSALPGAAVSVHCVCLFNDAIRGCFSLQLCFRRQEDLNLDASIPSRQLDAPAASSSGGDDAMVLNRRDSGVQGSARSFSACVGSLSRLQRQFLYSRLARAHCLKEVHEGDAEEMIQSWYASYFLLPARPRSHQVILDDLLPIPNAFSARILDPAYTAGKQEIKVCPCPTFAFLLSTVCVTVS